MQDGAHSRLRPGEGDCDRLRFMRALEAEGTTAGLSTAGLSEDLRKLPSGKNTERTAGALSGPSRHGLALTVKQSSIVDHGRGRERLDQRRVVNRIVGQFRTGAAWQDAPEHPVVASDGRQHLPGGSRGRGPPCLRPAGRRTGKEVPQ